LAAVMNTAEKIARLFFDSTSEHMIRINFFNRTIDGSRRI
jgi:hypothetical protein